MKKSLLKKALVYLIVLLFFELFPSISGLMGVNGSISIEEINKLQILSQESAFMDPPSYFDLRYVSGKCYVTEVKNQSGSTCWCFATMASIESNLLMTDIWTGEGEYGEPDLAEYHLDWWNGFNIYCNDDDPGSGGVIPHLGGDNFMASAYISRGEGAIREIDAPYPQSYEEAPERYEKSYHIYYPQNIEWYIAGSNLSNINTIKEKIMTKGAIVSFHCKAKPNYFYDYGSYWVYYQPPNSTNDSSTHSITIIGWDDNKITPAPLPGAWLIKDSHDKVGPEQGYYWISYYDKHCCQNPSHGAVSYQDVELLNYDHIYYHDYHGWRDTIENMNKVFNKFIATDDECIKAVSFFTAQDNINYQIIIYDSFIDGQLKNELSSKSGLITFKGFHTIILDYFVNLSEGEDFYIYLFLSNGGQPIDRTSFQSTLGDRDLFIVNSSAKPNESYYLYGSEWRDLYNYTFENSSWDKTANFCIKGLTKFTGAKLCILTKDIYRENIPRGSTVTGEIIIKNCGDADTFLNWEIYTQPGWGDWSFNPSYGKNLPAGVSFKINVTVDLPNDYKSYYHGKIEIRNIDNPNNSGNVPVAIYIKARFRQFFLKNLFFYKFFIIYSNLSKTLIRLSLKK